MSNTDALSAMLAQYEANQRRANKSEQATKYDEKNYFNTMLKKSELNATKRIRILPTADGSSPFVEIYGHRIEVNGEKKTFICPKHMDKEDCPFCEANDALRASGTEENKELAKKYNARKMYVVKIIDRDDEQHGPKFWRFNHDYRNQGAFDKIMGIVKTLKQNILDPENGRDLSIVIARDQSNNPVIQSITQFDKSPLHEDKSIADEWLNDEKTWRNVFSVKPYDYLAIIVKGGNPFYDKDNKMWIDKDSVQTTTQNDTQTQQVLTTPDTVLSSDNIVPDEIEDDLPF